MARIVTALATIVLAAVIAAVVLASSGTPDASSSAAAAPSETVADKFAPTTTTYPAPKTSPSDSELAQWNGCVPPIPREQYSAFTASASEDCLANYRRSVFEMQQTNRELWLAQCVGDAGETTCSGVQDLSPDTLRALCGSTEIAECGSYYGRPPDTNNGECRQGQIWPIDRCANTEHYLRQLKEASPH